MKGELNMKEYQKPEIELLDFTAEPIANETFETEYGVITGPSENDEI